MDSCLNKDPENRPTAKELLKYTFIRKAKKNSYLIDLIDRYKDYRKTKSYSDSESDPSDSEESNSTSDMEDPAWNMTVKSPPENLSAAMQEMELESQRTTQLESSNHRGAGAPDSPSSTPTEEVAVFNNKNTSSHAISASQSSPTRTEHNGAAAPQGFVGATLVPLIRAAHHEANASQHHAADEKLALELCGSLEALERSTPGVAESLVRELLVALRPQLQAQPQQLKQALHSLRR